MRESYVSPIQSYENVADFFHFQLSDLLFFLALLVIFIASYGIMAQALLFPNAVPQAKILKRIFYNPYWTMNGEFDLELAEGL
jgi:hypothetical protein